MSGVPLSLALGRCAEACTLAELHPTPDQVARAAVALHTTAVVLAGHGVRVPGFGEVAEPVLVALETDAGPWTQELPSEAAAHRWLAVRLGDEPRVTRARIGGRLVVGDPDPLGWALPAYPMISELLGGVL